MRIVALHGFTGSGADFDPLAARLEMPVFAPDLLGHGGAPDPVEPRAHRMSAQAERIATQVGDGPVVLLGYSLGGRVALRRPRRPGTVLRLVQIRERRQMRSVIGVLFGPGPP